MRRASVRRRKSAPSISPTCYWWPITEEKIREAIQRITHVIHPEKVILFGSFAYGQPTADSDVDLLVIMESEQSAHARSAQISEILYPRPFPVDIIVRTPQEIAERLSLGDCFFQEIMTKGKVLYERPSR